MRRPFFPRSDDGSICRANSLTIRCTVTVLALALLIGVWQGGVPERAPADTLMQQGAAAMQSGDHARAEALFRRALAADPRSGDAHVYLGVLADQAGRLSDAERHFATAVALDRKSVV